MSFKNIFSSIVRIRVLWMLSKRNQLPEKREKLGELFSEGDDIEADGIR